MTKKTTFEEKVENSTSSETTRNLMMMEIIRQLARIANVLEKKL